MDTDIRDEIDRSFGDGPPVDDSALLLTRGRAAVRRRRVVEGGSLLLVAGAVVAVALLSTGDGTGTTSPAPAGPPTSSPTSTPSTATDPPPRGTARTDFPPPAGAPVIVDDGIQADWPLALQRDGLHVSPKVTILTVVDDPWNYRPQGAWSLAVSYRDAKRDVIWWAGYVDQGGGGLSSTTGASETKLDFDAWVATQNDGLGYGDEQDPPTTPDGGWPGTVRLDLVRLAADSERLEPSGAGTIIEQRSHPALPDSFATADDRSAVAEVRLDGVRYYVLARQIQGDPKPQYIAVKAAKGGATLDDFLDLARERYAEGGGGLL